MKHTATSKRLTSNEIEAANLAEATALLIRAGFRVYRPEADCDGEDLILRENRKPSGKLLVVQLKSRPTVNRKKYGGRSLWMLFPDPKSNTALDRKWFLVLHDRLYEEMKRWHGHTAKWNETWSEKRVSKKLGLFLKKFTVIPS
ncbi:MAG: hypothetical protein LAP21_13450 [Acidobacteriia bacterium]|nr:hypothetical protein [Terriglobia bacterium]